MGGQSCKRLYDEECYKVEHEQGVCVVDIRGSTTFLHCQQVSFLLVENPSSVKFRSLDACITKQIWQRMENHIITPHLLHQLQRRVRRTTLPVQCITW